MTPKNEADRIMKLVKGDMLNALAIVKDQLQVLHTRAQVLLSLAGVVITVTGFSGRIIADTNKASQLFIIAGLFTVLLSAVIMSTKVMSVKWLTGEVYGDDLETLQGIIRRRNSKTTAYQLGGRVLILGIFLYCVAVSIMLMNPAPLAIAPR